MRRRVVDDMGSPWRYLTSDRGSTYAATATRRNSCWFRAWSLLLLGFAIVRSNALELEHTSIVGVRDYKL